MTKLEQFLIRLALKSRIPFSRQFLAWSSRCQFADMEPTSPPYYDFEIPDPSHPIPEDEQGVVGPSSRLIPFVPQILVEKQVLGRRIDEVSPYVGTYGMGGAGFLGLRLENEWLVFAIGGAGEWITVDGILVEDFFFENYERPEPWIHNGNDTLSPKLIGAKVVSLRVHERSLEMSFSNGMSLSIDEASEGRPLFEGNKQRREFLAGEDLRKAVFLAPTAEIWI